MASTIMGSALFSQSAALSGAASSPTHGMAMKLTEMRNGRE